MTTAQSRGDLILVFDAGTQSVRAALIDHEGRIKQIVKTPITPYFSHHPGWAEQDPGYFWDSLAAASRKLLGGEGVDRGRIAGVTLTTQRDTIINLDKNGMPLRPAIIWLDQRRADRTGNLHLVLGAQGHQSIHAPGESRTGMQSQLDSTKPARNLGANA